MEIKAIRGRVVDAAMKVHSALGPRLFGLGGRWNLPQRTQRREEGI
jgi:hypothetical protein